MTECRGLRHLRAGYVLDAFQAKRTVTSQSAWQERGGEKQKQYDGMECCIIFLMLGVARCNCLSQLGPDL